MRILITATTSVLLCVTVMAQDLRSKYGTASEECTRAIDRAIQLSQGGNQQFAMTEIQTALNHDPGSAMARYWLGNILSDMGETKRGLAEYKTLVEAWRATGEGDIPGVVVSAAFNLGITAGKAGNHMEARYWMSQIVLHDMGDANKYHWRAYRNMAIEARDMRDGLSALALINKARALAPDRVSGMQVDTYTEGAQIQPVISLLQFDLEPAPAPPSPKSSLPHLERIADLERKLNHTLKVKCITRDSSGKRLYVFYVGQPVADVILTEKQDIKRIQLPCAVECASSAGPDLYAGRSGTTGFVRMDLDGKLIRTYDLPTSVSSLAVCPVTSQAFVSTDNAIQVVNLANGKTTPTDLIGQVVCIDPRRQLLYATYMKATEDDLQMAVTHDGRLVFYQPMNFLFGDRNIVMKAAYKTGGLTAIGNIRLYAGWRGTSMDLSADGRWLTVAGGGGYCGPEANGASGIGVMTADAMEKVAPFCPSDKNPLAAAFNPSGTQLAITGTNDLRVYSLGTMTPPFVCTGGYGSAICWSGNGNFLVVARATSGAQVFLSKVTADETAYATRMANTSDLTPNATKKIGMTGLSNDVRVRINAGLRSFEPDHALALAVARARTATLSTNTVASPRWEQSAIYNRDTNIENAAARIHQALDGGSEDIGIMIYQARQILATIPDYLPALAALARMDLLRGNTTGAVVRLTEVIRGDAGQSSLTADALCQLGRAYQKLGKDAEALSTLAVGLSLDRWHSATCDAIRPLMQKHGVPFAASPVSAASPTYKGNSTVGTFKLPSLPQGKQTLTEALLLDATVEQVVRVKAGELGGSGVPITDDGVLLTCDHLVEGGATEVEVVFYRKSGNSITEAGTRKASVIYRDATTDIALLRMKDPPKSLKALPLATQMPKIGTRVMVVGSTVLGKQVLPQTVTVGMVNGVERTVSNRKVMQHSAAVNPGNSGSPLFGYDGVILGIVTQEKGLENSKCAIPACRIREVLEKTH